MATPTSKHLIYALVDPRSGQWRYIGKTEGRLPKRMNEHWSRAWKKGSDGRFEFIQHLYCWIRSLGGARPEMALVEECDSHAHLVDAECEWIAAARAAGVDLTNGTAGGEGAVGYKHGPEARRRISAAKRGRPSPKRGTHLTRETKLQVSRTKTGLTAEQQEAAVRLYETGLDSHRVGARFGVSSTCVLGLLGLFGVQPRDRSASRRKDRFRSAA